MKEGLKEGLPMNQKSAVAKIKTQFDQLKNRKILVIGDIGLDEYVMGEVKRISPEAPVPVVEVRSEDQRLGLAANVAQNVVSLGGQAFLISVIGADTAGHQVRQQLNEKGVSDEFLITDRSRPTIRKLRIMAEHHHLVRVDYELKNYLSKEIESQLLETAKRILPQCDGVIIEDYAKGLLSETCLQSIIQLSHLFQKKVMIDPHRSTPVHFYKGADLLKPNRDEAIILSGMDPDHVLRDPDSYLKVGMILKEKAQVQNLIMTRGKDGMTLFEHHKTSHLPTYARQVFDVTGAGDTVVAALAIAWYSGWTLDEACVLANYAAGVVVGKVGCVPCSKTELMDYIESLESNPVP